MKCAFTLCIAALLCAPVCTASAELTIATDGQSNYKIVVPNDRTTAIDYAATELQRLLRDVSGVKLEIATERQAGPGPAFLVGPSKRVPRSLIVKAGRLTGDGVLIKTVDNDIVLLGGNDRGQLYSVYTFLEKYLGCRFLAQDCTVTLRREALAIPRIAYSYSPPLIYREELYYDAAVWDFAARQRINGGNMFAVLRRPWPDKSEIIPGVTIFPFAHSSMMMVPLSTYLSSNPEYYGLVNGKRQGATIGGQLCFTNPDVLRIAKEKVFEWFKQYPTLTSVDVSQNDAYAGAYGACECEQCAAVVKEEGSQMGPILRFVNAIADAVKEKYPDKYVDTLAYQYTVTPPKITKPRDNVIIRLCHTGCYFHGVEQEPISAELRAAIDGWHKIAKHVLVWHYAVSFGHYFAPNPNLNGIAKDIRYYASHGVDGVMIQGDYQSPVGELAELRQYLTAQLMWDPSQDPMAIRTDFCKGYYGPAADDALEFLALMDKLGENPQQHACMGWDPSSLATPEFVSEGMAILNSAHAKAITRADCNHVEKLMMPLWYVQLVWPDRYGMSKEQCREVLARFKRVVEVNGVLNSSEAFQVNSDGSAPLVSNIAGFIAGMDARYAAGK